MLGGKSPSSVRHRSNQLTFLFDQRPNERASLQLSQTKRMRKSKYPHFCVTICLPGSIELFMVTLLVQTPDPSLILLTQSQVSV